MSHTCGRRHQTYRTVAGCLYPRAVWIRGDGPFALIAHCGVTTVSLWRNLTDAEQTKAFIDRTGCGGRCHQRHEIVSLDHPAAAS